MPPVLLVIDLQNDFLSPNGEVAVNAFQTDDFLENISRLCQNFRGKTVFIQSEYLDPAYYDAHKPLGNQGFRSPIRPGSTARAATATFLRGTHQGRRKICAPGSAGAELIPAAQDLAGRFAHRVVTKNWYSAFASTGLHRWLQDQGVGDGPLCLAGVTANNCVLATAADGFFLGYRVRVLRDCVGATSERLLTEALDKVERYYGQVVSLEQVIGSAPSKLDARQPPLEYDGKRTLYYVNGSIPSWRVMLLLAYKKIPYRRKRLRVMTPVRETRVQEFLEINPRGKTPVLIDEDGTVIAESMAILEYLEMYYPEPPTLPDPKEKAAHARVLQRFHESENLHNVFEDIELLFTDGWKTHEDQRVRILDAYESTRKELGFWEAHLAEAAQGEGGYTAGDSLSIADFAMYPSLAYLIHRGLDLDQEGFPRLKEYHERFNRTSWGEDARPKGYERVAKSNLIKKIYEGSLEKTGKD